MMNEAQLNRSKDIEYSIIKLAIFKLNMIARRDAAGYKRICKQQIQAAMVGLQIITELQNQSQKTINEQ
jgi:hypothetical protein